MKNFIVYDATTGVVKRFGMCQDDMVDSQAQSGEDAIEGTITLGQLSTATVNPVTKVLNA